MLQKSSNNTSVHSASFSQTNDYQFQQLRFIAFWLITNWNVSPTTVEVGAYLYDNVTARALTDFNIPSTIALRNDINSANSFYYQDSPSISKLVLLL